MTTRSEPLAAAIEHHRGGRLDAAEKEYRQLLDANPNNADAWHLLGLVLSQLGRHDEAVSRIRWAIELSPQSALYHRNLATICQQAGRYKDAMAAFRAAIALEPTSIDLFNGLGAVANQEGERDVAIEAFRQGLVHNPDHVDTLSNLGAALQESGKPAEGEPFLRRAVELSPGNIAALCNLGAVLNSLRRADEAEVVLRQVLQQQPDLAEAQTNLGVALATQGKLQEAADAYVRALELRPGMAEAYSYLGVIFSRQLNYDKALACQRRALELKPQLAWAHVRLARDWVDQHCPEEAVSSCRQALVIQPDLALAYNIMASALLSQGLLEDAKACYRRSMSLDSVNPSAHTNIIFAMYHDPALDAAAILEECKRWDKAHCPAVEVEPHPNDRNPHRKLRIGYVSPDFRNHPVSNTMVPLLKAHDRRQFEVHLFSNLTSPDAVTEHLMGAADGWHSIVGRADPNAARMIRDAGIDILVDLALHTGENRLQLFAQKPAPVQVTWLGLAGTTGVSAIDYRLTDPYMDPPGQHDSLYSETSVRLSETYWCYESLVESISTSGLPAARAGHVTFSCMNRTAKINDVTLKLWSKILRATGRSQLVLVSPPGSHRGRTLAILSQQGIAPERVRFLDWQPRRDYLSEYHKVDIGLDTFPYNGGVSTCDALWMGVPVVSLVGNSAISRAGLSVLSNVGLEDLAARTPDDYVRSAVTLAGDLDRLADLRESLRSRMQDSPLMDRARFARSLESAFRSMWYRWCESF